MNKVGRSLRLKAADLPGRLGWKMPSEKSPEVTGLRRFHPDGDGGGKGNGELD